MGGDLNNLVNRLRPPLKQVAGLRYAVLFGSMARGEAHARSDVDVAVAGLDLPARLDLTGRLELAAHRPVQVVAMEEAPLGLRFRIFRDGVLLVEPDPRQRQADQVQTLLEHLDFQPVERILRQGLFRSFTEPLRHGG